MRQSFDKSWEEIHAQQEWGKYPSEPIIRFVARNFYNFISPSCKTRHDIKILDFGCGGGAHTWFLAREGFDTYAFDGSKSAVKKAQQYLKKDGLHANLTVCDALQLPYEDNFFHAVIDSACIYANCLNDIKTMYQRVYCLLKPDGLLFSSSFSPQTTGYATGEPLEPNTYRNLTEGALAGRGTVHFFEKSELNSILQEIGYKNITIETLDYTDRGSVVSMFHVIAQK